MEINYRKLQFDICKKYGAEFMDTPMSLLIGFSNSTFEKGLAPINGLRHPIHKPDVSNWYIWAGQEISESEDFFKPIHIEHLVSICPRVISYLGLPPGWRFLYDGEYEDVWYDPSLLETEYMH